MITVTNQKVAGFTPRWGSFRGFTLLFDNPDSSFAAWRNDTLLLQTDVANDPSLAFYRGLRGGLEQLDLDLLTETYLFCPLPPASYQVTAWDGANDGNLARIHDPYRVEFAQWIAELPASLPRPMTLAAKPHASALRTNRDWRIRFKFDFLYKWSNVAMVACLRPADDQAAADLARFTAARDSLNLDFRQTFGVNAKEVYLPHVTLGYFANRQSAQLATPCMEDWNAAFVEAMADLTLSFDHISLYGFTDMETFFKLPS